MRIGFILASGQLSRLAFVAALPMEVPMSDTEHAEVGLCPASIEHELQDFIATYDLDIARERDEDLFRFAERVIEALADKLVAIDTAIERIEAVFDATGTPQ
jgi:hypothetical protein